MKSNSLKVKLGELCEIRNGYAFKSKEFCRSGVPVIKIKNVKPNKIILDDFSYVSEDVAESKSKWLVNFGDILLTMTGNRADGSPDSWVGKAAIFTYQGRYLLNQRVAAITAVSEKVDNMYLGYFLSSWESQLYFIKRSNSSGGQANISPDIVRNMDIILPSLDEQKKIVKILYSIDQKIELNNKINDNLEQQAQALFKTCFIDFRPYGGKCPDDWKVASLGDVCLKITDGSHFSPKDDPTAPYPMYSVKDMGQFGFNYSSCKHISQADFDRMRKNDCVPLKDDILIAKDGSYLKEIFICNEEKEEAILSSIAIFRPDRRVIYPEILLYLLKQSCVRKDVGENYVSGSVLPRIVLKDFKKYQFILPTLAEQKKIVGMIKAIRYSIDCNVKEIQNLMRLRDTLLPKLMSGEIDVSNITI